MFTDSNFGIKSYKTGLLPRTNNVKNPVNQKQTESIPVTNISFARKTANVNTYTNQHGDVFEQSIPKKAHNKEQDKKNFVEWLYSDRHLIYF
jgi:hypothetical protein